MGAVRSARCVWSGDLLKGKGEVTAQSSGAYKNLPVTWASRTETADGRTSPEELIASAHASCYCMAFSGALAKAGTPPSELDVTCSVTFEQVSGGWKVKSSALDVKGKVPGIDDAAFQKAAEGAKDGCPVSGALKGNVELSVKATLVR